MKRKTIIYSIVAVALSVFLASLTLAECPPGQAEVTIVIPAGRVIEICVPDHVFEAGNVGGNNDVFIPAICPGFNQEEVQAELTANPNIVCRRYDGSTTKTGDPCTYIECSEVPSKDDYFAALEGPEDLNVYGNCEFVDVNVEEDNNIVWNYVSGYSSHTISEAEADACVAILNTFVVETPGDDCSNPFVIPAGQSTFQDSGDTTLAMNDYQTTELGENAPDVVYQFTPAKTANYAFGVKPTSNWDVALYIVTDCNDIVGFLVDSINKGIEGQSESLEVTLQGGTTYYLIVDGATKSQSGPYDMALKYP